jgi:hypothetical protein
MLDNTINDVTPFYPVPVLPIDREGKNITLSAVKRSSRFKSREPVNHQNPKLIKQGGPTL